MFWFCYYYNLASCVLMKFCVEAQFVFFIRFSVQTNLSHSLTHSLIVVYSSTEKPWAANLLSHKWTWLLSMPWLALHPSPSPCPILIKRQYIDFQQAHASVEGQFIKSKSIHSTLMSLLWAQAHLLNVTGVLLHLAAPTATGLGVVSPTSCCVSKMLYLIQSEFDLCVSMCVQYTLPGSMVPITELRCLRRELTTGTDWTLRTV